MTDFNARKKHFSTRRMQQSTSILISPTGVWICASIRGSGKSGPKRWSLMLARARVVFVWWVSFVFILNNARGVAVCKCSRNVRVRPLMLRRINYENQLPVFLTLAVSLIINLLKRALARPKSRTRFIFVWPRAHTASTNISLLHAALQCIYTFIFISGLFSALGRPFADFLPADSSLFHFIVHWLANSSHHLARTQESHAYAFWYTLWLHKITRDRAARLLVKKSLEIEREEKRRAQSCAFAILINAERDVKRENCSSFWATILTHYMVEI